jgi:type I restriction enzyme S subunit
MKDSGIDWFGEIPEHWEIRRLKNAMNFNPSLEVDINLQDDTVVSFMPMECLRTDYIEKRESNYKDVKGYVPFQNGDVVMAKVTPCFENRNIAVANELANGVGFGTSEIFVFRCTKILTNKFLMYFLQTEYFRNNAIASMTGTGGLKRVSPKVARNIQLPIPDKSEQIEIVELLGKKCNSIEKMISSIMNEINTIQEYKTSLISDVVTGKVDVRDVSIEDAFEMETLDEVEVESEEMVEE